MSAVAQSTAFDIYATFQQFLKDDEVSLSLIVVGPHSWSCLDIATISSYLVASGGDREVQWCVSIAKPVI